jgi:hypothetical protein
MEKKAVGYRPVERSIPEKYHDDGANWVRKN